MMTGPASPRLLTTRDLVQLVRGVDRTKDAWLAALTNRLMGLSALAGESLADRRALSKRIQAAGTQVVDEDLQSVIECGS